MRVLPFCVLTLVSVALAQSDKGVILVSRRLALVIGNTNYKNLPPIPPARNDANDMAFELRRLGFEVTLETDLGLTKTIQAVDSFASGIQAEDLAMVYYSGHGGQLGEENYILPVDYDPPGPQDPDLVPRRAYKMSELRDRIEGTRARVRVLVFDACRSSPLLTIKGLTKDYAAVSGKPEGTIIAFASAHSQPAGFTPGNRNSAFTQEFLAALRQPRLPDLESLFMQVRIRVFERTNRTQTPYLYGFLSGPVYLSGGSPAVAAQTLPAHYSAENSSSRIDFSSRPPVPVQPGQAEAASLLVQPDVDATVAVDDQAGVVVHAWQSRRFSVLPGSHFVRATAGKATQQETVEVKYGEQQAVPLAFASPVEAEEEKLDALMGVWTGSGESDASERQLQLSPGIGPNEMTATYHEVDNSTSIYDAVFRLHMFGSVLKGSSESAGWKDSSGHKQQYFGVVFSATVDDPKHIRYRICWQEAPDETSRLRSLGTFTKQMPYNRNVSTSYNRGYAAPNYGRYSAPSSRGSSPGANYGARTFSRSLHSFGKGVIDGWRSSGGFSGVDWSGGGSSGPR